MEIFHRPVLLNEAIEILSLQEGKNIIDATCGGGGHTKEILKRISPGGKVLAIDWDDAMLKKAQENLKSYKNSVIFKQGNYADIKKIINDFNFTNLQWHGILFDFGFALDHVKSSGRGFSFLKDEPLDMRYNLNNDLTAATILNQYSRKDLAKIFSAYGQENNFNKIVDAIYKYRKRKKIETTRELNDIVAKTILADKMRIHPSTKIFQALRIEVNDELKNIATGLNDGFDVIQENGVMAAISFHSLEDRIIKDFFREKKQEKTAKILTNKPIRPTPKDIFINPASRSAKLRAIRKSLHA